MQKQIDKRTPENELKRPLKDFIHDIRNPLGAIAGFSELLEDTPLNEEQKELIELIKGACKNANKVINREIDQTFTN